MNKTIKYARIGLYVDREDYLKLRAKLVRKNKSVSNWVREKVLEEITSK